MRNKTTTKTHLVRTLIIGALTISTLGITACSSTKTAVQGGTVTLVAYDSFTPSPSVLKTFTEATGIKVTIVTSGDTGELVNKAILTRDHPLGDVLYGVDTTFLSRSVAEGIFSPYRPESIGEVDPRFSDLVPGHQVTPVDYGDVCINFDKQTLAKRGVTPPASLQDLTDPKYKDMLAVENPATSSPGLAFLLATVSTFGSTVESTVGSTPSNRNWQQYWKALRANGVKVVNGWDEAWNTEFSAGDGKGPRPIVVSYASSPPAAIVFGPDPKATTTPIGVAADTCFRSIEFAGVLRNAKHPREAQALIDFLISSAFQHDLALSMFVYPVRSNEPLPDVFTKFAVTPAKPITMTPQTISANRERWIDEWNQTVLG